MADSLLTGKSALITGAAQGIGAAIARLFAAQGAKVVIADINEEGGAETAAHITKDGGDATFLRTDVTSAADLDAAVRATVTAHGKLDIAVNNAGIEEQGSALHEITEEAWDRLVSVNLKGVWLSMKSEITQMLAQGGGTIVNMASVAGLVGLPLGIADYSAAKGGVIALTRTAAIEYVKQGIRINAVCPGVVRTALLDNAITTGMFTEAEAAALHPSGVLIDPADVAETFLFLASGASKHITGQALPVDAGLAAG
ncbi:SDR family oxidoreductase [Amycolatopsis endophytica]|uniref:NAD(P)-dependent dehydrogenase (Short-subunit alcohol dehydrogenase family) n=1 Tax=Amycolatopsis endophytica TaxID=860233 RepID=A0A853B2Y8_9PSEU|nr:glucose 1-dehydrogenase [Amycolatopsis endophytica]NYI89488.1 NAD(P)-dependent dehydrogenase (short-subunit alcohol dehydrogenase family) [Amycolatopsis endophytica]